MSISLDDKAIYTGTMVIQGYACENVPRSTAKEAELLARLFSIYLWNTWCIVLIIHSEALWPWHQCFRCVLSVQSILDTRATGAAVHHLAATEYLVLCVRLCLKWSSQKLEEFCLWLLCWLKMRYVGDVVKRFNNSKLYFVYIIIICLKF